MQVLLREQLPFILLADNGFRDYYKPSDILFDACAAGRVLILSPWPYDANKRHITREECVALNAMAEEICNYLSIQLLILSSVRCSFSSVSSSVRCNFLFCFFHSVQFLIRLFFRSVQCHCTSLLYFFSYLNGIRLRANRYYELSLTGSKTSPLYDFYDRIKNLFPRFTALTFCCRNKKTFHPNI